MSGAEDLVGEYRGLILQKRELSDQPRLGNKLVPRMVEIIGILGSSSAGRSALAGLMDDSDEGIRLSAAADSLPWDDQRAVAVLTEIAAISDVPNFNAFRARIILKGHFDGTRPR